MSVTDGPDGVVVVVVIMIIVVVVDVNGGNGEGAISPICWHEEETLSELIL